MKVKALAKDIFSVEMLLYMLFGIGTAAIDYFVEVILYDALPFSSHTVVVISANSASFALSVLFAFWTNRKFVFKRKKSSKRAVAIEGAKFFISRLSTFALSLIGMLLLVDSLGLNNDVSKIAVTAVTIVLNYLFSKLIVFPKELEQELAEN